MIKYVQNKNIDFSLFEEKLALTSQKNQYTNSGPAKKLLEKKLEDLLGISSDKSVLCVANGTLALHSIYIFLKKRYGNLKIVSPSFTFPSCVVGGYQVDALDIESENYTIPLTEENIKKYDVFVVTNLFGTFPSNINRWVNVCRENKKVLIFDNASSPLSEVEGINICNFGDFSFGSLHHTKYIGFGEGGFLVLPSDLYEEFESILGFGFESGSKIRTHSVYSSNYKISDVTSAAVLQHLDRYDFKKHKQNQDCLLSEIGNIVGVEPFNYSEGVVYGNFPILYNKIKSESSFLQDNIEAKKYYYPLSNHQNSMNLYNKIINLPLHCQLEESDLEKIISSIKRSVDV